jgi:hypothetical protein
VAALNGTYMGQHGGHSSPVTRPPSSPASGP